MNTQSLDSFIDFYQILDIDLLADPKEIEKQFFEMGQKLHPNVPVTGDKDKFEILTQAFQTLRVPENRQAYDEIYMEQESLRLQESGVSIGEPLGSEKDRDQDSLDATMENIDLEKEAQDRILLMKKFYERRRMNPQSSGLASGALEGVIQCSSTMLDFHIWYCHLKGWLYREESGQLSITAEGVDHVENGLR